MAISVKSVPATKNRFSAKSIGTNHKRKVAGYARVSTELEEQTTSFETQIDYYTRFIKSHTEWQFVDVYSDEGITGTSTNKRAGFQKMIANALSGGIDLILTKSVSRFARNTVDTLTTIRQLKDHGVEVYFEKENIWTFDSKGELLLTIMASLAQEESRSISENIRWAVNKKFEKGRFSLPYKCFLGYDRGDDGMPVVNKEEAEVIKKIYQLYLLGHSPRSIIDYLETNGIKAPGGGDRWFYNTVRSILTNEKYSGNAILQKHFSTDFLSKKQLVNNGEVPKYYVTGSHEAIISPEEFDLVQLEMKTRIENKQNKYGSSIFAGKVFCGECGSAFGAKVWHSQDKYRRVVFQCDGKYKNHEHHCSTPHLTEEGLKQVCIKAINSRLDNKDEVIENLEELKKVLYDTTAIEKDMVKVDSELEVTIGLLAKSISSGPLKDSGALDELNERHAQLKTRKQEIKDEITRRKAAIASFNRTIRELKGTDEILTDFSEPLFVALIDRLTVYSKEKTIIRFNDGSEYEYQTV